MSQKNYAVRNIKAAITKASFGYLKGKRRTVLGNALVKAVGGTV